MKSTVHIWTARQTCDSKPTFQTTAAYEPTARAEAERLNKKGESPADAKKRIDRERRLTAEALEKQRQIKAAWAAHRRYALADPDAQPIRVDKREGPALISMKGA